MCKTRTSRGLTDFEDTSTNYQATTQFSLEYVCSNTEILLTWSDPDILFTGYTIDTRLDCSKW